MSLKNLFLGIIMISSATGILSAYPSDKVYLEHEYPVDHWSVVPKDFNDDHVVGFSKYKDSEYSIYLDYGDSRGYRTIVRLTNSPNLASTFNRDYNAEERAGLAMTIAAVSQAFERIVPISQSATLGNNSHSFNSDTNMTQIGQAHEPCMLHAHIWGRGNPETEYVEGVKLDGPIPFEIFDLRINKNGIQGNNLRKPWASGEAKLVSQRLNNALAEVASGYDHLQFTLN